MDDNVFLNHRTTFSCVSTPLPPPTSIGTDGKALPLLLSPACLHPLSDPVHSSCKDRAKAILSSVYLQRENINFGKKSQTNMAHNNWGIYRFRVDGVGSVS